MTAITKTNIVDPIVTFQITEHIKPIKLDNKKKYIHDLYNIIDSWTGRMDAQFTITFTLESQKLIVNSLHLYEMGYFDCAYYSLREALDLSTLMIYFLEMSDDEKNQKMNEWKKLKSMPLYKDMIKFLTENSATFIDARNKLNSFFEDIKNDKIAIDKVVHKQSYNYLYVSRNHPLSTVDDEKEKQKFEYYVKKCISAITIMRLLVDPMPILLMDEEIYHRTNDTMTKPFNKNFVDEYIGEDNINKYKNTDVYINHYNSFIFEEKHKESVSLVIKEHYIDLEKLEEIREQIGHLGYTDFVAVAVAACSKKVCKIFFYNGLLFYWTSAKSSFPNEWCSTELTKHVSNNNVFNIVGYYDMYLTHLFIKNKSVYIEHNYKFNKSDIENLNRLVTEINLTQIDNIN